MVVTSWHLVIVTRSPGYAKRHLVDKIRSPGMTINHPVNLNRADSLDELTNSE